MGVSSSRMGCDWTVCASPAPASSEVGPVVGPSPPPEVTEADGGVDADVCWSASLIRAAWGGGPSSVIEKAAEVLFRDPLPKCPPTRLADIKEHVGAVDRVVPIYLIEPMVLMHVLKSFK